MSAALAVRARLYDELRSTWRPRRRRALRRQIAVLSTSTGGPDDGSAGTREPRRPRPAPPGQSSSAL